MILIGKGFISFSETKSIYEALSVGGVIQLKDSNIGKSLKIQISNGKGYKIFEVFADDDVDKDNVLIDMVSSSEREEYKKQIKKEKEQEKLELKEKQEELLAKEEIDLDKPVEEEVLF